MMLDCAVVFTKCTDSFPFLSNSNFEHGPLFWAYKLHCNINKNHALFFCLHFYDDFDIVLSLYSVNPAAKWVCLAVRLHV